MWRVYAGAYPDALIPGISSLHEGEATTATYCGALLAEGVHAAALRAGRLGDSPKVEDEPHGAALFASVAEGVTTSAEIDEVTHAAVQ